ncbi:hypothetical protein JXI42_01800 [bacterium]|nr:hypothetical protein [bacterium]
MKNLFLQWGNPIVFAMIAFLLFLPFSTSYALINTKYFSLNGDINTYYQYYTVSGIEARESPHTFHFKVNPYIDIAGITLDIETDIDYYLSAAPQFILPSFNQFSIEPSWSWGGLQFMDFYPYMSDLILNGIALRGTALQLHPGAFNFYLLGGEVKQDSSAYYDRRIYGLQIGAGPLNLNILKGRDQYDEIPEGEDTLAITPEENLIIGLQLGFHLLGLDWAGEAAVSGYTRNLASDKIDMGDFDFLSGIFPVRTSSYVDAAYSVSLSKTAPFGSFSASMDYIGPGYTSLGLYSTINDTWDSKFSINLYPIQMLSLSSAYTQTRDNLYNNLMETTFYRNFSTYLSVAPSPYFSNTFYYYFYRTDNDAEVDSSIIDNGTHSFSVSPYFYFRTNTINHGLSLSYTLQRTKDKNPVSPYTSSANSITAYYSTQFSSVFSTNLGFTWTSSETEEYDLRSTSYSAGMNYDAFNGVFPVSLSASYNPSNQGDLFYSSLSPTLRITGADAIEFDVDLSIFSDAPADSSNYTEFTAQVSYTRSF